MPRPGSLTLLLDQFVLLDLSVANEDDAVRMQRDVVLVRDQDDRVALLVQALEQRHDFVAGRGVEVAGRLVGEQDGRVDSRARARWRRAGADRPSSSFGLWCMRRSRSTAAAPAWRVSMRSSAGMPAVDQRQLDVVQRRWRAAAG